MKVTFAEKSPAPVMERTILLGDEPIGWMRTTDHASEATKWHAGFNLDTGDSMGFTHLIQGFGATEQDAIDNAIDKAIDFSDKVKIAAMSLMDQVHSQGDRYEK